MASPGTDSIHLSLRRINFQGFAGYCDLVSASQWVIRVVSLVCDRIDI